MVVILANYMYKSINGSLGIHIELVNTNAMNRNFTGQKLSWIAFAVSF